MGYRFMGIKEYKEISIYRGIVAAFFMEEVPPLNYSVCRDRESLTGYVDCEKDRVVDII